jgi:hypothetical protein
MFGRLQAVAVIGILCALVWIAYELHNLNRRGLTIDGMIDADCHLPTRAIEVEIVK